MATEITCQLDETIEQTDGATGTLIVFLKTSEEAACDAAVCQGFTFTSTLPTVNVVNAAYDAATNQWDVVVTGTGFPTVTTNNVLYVGEVEQTAKTSSAIEAVFTLIDVTDTVVSGMRLFFTEGKPAGHL
jgi:hypothetical protein